MTQSGTGSFTVGIGYNKVNGQEQLSFTLKIPTTFSKPFINIPVILLNITGVGPATSKQANVGISNVLQYLNSYQVLPQSVTVTGFEAVIEYNIVWHPTPFSENAQLYINYNWLAYDEVTIGA